MIFVGPMTKNIVDAAIEFANERDISLGFIPSRRQVEFSGGYANRWTTKSFCSYVRDRSNKIILQRDHAGPGQGFEDDDGYESLREDCLNFDIIHLDPWKKYKDYRDGLKWTADMLSFCHGINPALEYEVGTEQSIRQFEEKELERLLSDLAGSLGPMFERISFVVIQSGTSLSGNEQTGSYDEERLLGMLEVSRKFGIKAKEHNGDYIDPRVVRKKIRLGLDAINIAPEFGLIETQCYLDQMDEKNFEDFWRLCYESGRWRKWVGKDFDPIAQKQELVKICGHYMVSDERFVRMSEDFDATEAIKLEVKKRLNLLHAD